MKEFLEAILACLEAGGSSETREKVIAAGKKTRLRIFPFEEWIDWLLEGVEVPWAELLLSFDQSCPTALRRSLYERSPFVGKLLVLMKADGTLTVLPESMNRTAKLLGYKEEIGDFQAPQLAVYTPDRLIPTGRGLWR